MNAYELSSKVGGWAVGQAYAAKCPICNNDKATLSIWDQGDGIGLKCFYNAAGQCHPMALIYHWQSMGIDISVDDLSKGKKTTSKTWDALWHGAVPIIGTKADEYLFTRGIDFMKMNPAQLERLTTPLRCIDYLKHPTSVRYPAMIALIVDPITETPKAVHRTYLNHLGTGKAPVEPNKMSLGAARGGVVKFGQGDELITIAGGIETGMSYSLMEDCNVWCTIGEGNMAFIHFPERIKLVRLIEDQDTPGREAVAAAIGVFTVRGLQTEIIRPRPGFKDMNDELRGIKNATHVPTTEASS